MSDTPPINVRLELAAIAEHCPGWQPLHVTLSQSFGARLGWLQVHGADAAEVIERVRQVERTGLQPDAGEPS